MKIKTKLIFEVVVLVALIGTISFIVLANTKQVQNSFTNLSHETLPLLDTLKDMRYSSSMISSTTMKIILIEDESRNAEEAEYIELEEDLEEEFYQIEKAKTSFNLSFSEFSSIMENNYPDKHELVQQVGEKWNELILSSNKLIKMKTSGLSGVEIIQVKKELDTAHNNMNSILDDVTTVTANSVSKNSTLVNELVNETTLLIMIALNIFIAVSLAMRYVILRSISNPLINLRKTAAKIATGQFITAEIKGNDEIAELGLDINKMSKKLEKLNKKIIEAERLSSIGSLASRLAHDLRNPLSVIKNSMEIMKIRLEVDMDEKTNLLMARIGRSIERISHQIDDVLDYVNTSNLQFESHSISTIIESAIVNMKIPSLISIKMPKESCTLNCDAAKLEVVLINIISNSIQAIKQEGHINISVKDLDEYLILNIEDSGPGIPDNIKAKIFEPMFTTKQTGTGLGLASCKNIIEKHGGTINVQNNPTTFTIKLPKTPKNEKNLRHNIEYQSTLKHENVVQTK